MSSSRQPLGQHFLNHPYTISKIIDAIHPRPSQTFVEIGPGQGALTIPLVKQVEKLHVVEVDRNLIPYLNLIATENEPLSVHQADILRFDITPLATPLNRPLRMVGNLPYNISSAIIFHLLNYSALIKDMHFMLQKELVDRIVAAPGSKTYGRLSVMVQYYCEVQALFNVSPQAFTPPPKVDSSIIRLIPHRQLPHPAKDENRFADLVRQAFSHRRKTIYNALKRQVSWQQLEQLEISPQARPEQLSLATYVKLANALSRQEPQL